MLPARILYAAAGPANLVSAHRHHIAGTHEPSEVSITFSSEIEQFCDDIGAKAYLISVHPNGEKLDDGSVTIEHRPKRPSRGLGYYLEEIRYGLGLLKTARQWKADAVILDSGATLYFVMRVFAWFGMPVVVVLHNSLWPAHFRPTSMIRRLNDLLDTLFFWRRGPLAVIGVSPECSRQVKQMAPRHRYPVLETRAQFRQEFFDQIAPPPPHAQKPFQVMFIGRVDRIKGVLDIPVMARAIETAQPGLVRWEICGRGRDQDALTQAIADNNVGHVVHARGWTSLEDLIQVYGDSHAAIVPTRSSFAEGLAMTAAEAILAGRPLITNPVVPALELLEPACLAGATNDPQSHADAVLRLAEDRALYDQLRAACTGLGKPFLDREQGLRAVLHRAFGTGFKID